MKFFDTDFLRDEEIFLKLVRTAEANPEKEWLPAYHFDILKKDGQKVGLCDLRIGHNRKTYYGGNIGYTVAPEHRGHRYAAKACRLLFRLAKLHGMEYLIITCRPTNIASRKTCEYAGGVLKEIADLPQDSDLYTEDQKQECIYWFDLR